MSAGLANFFQRATEAFRQRVWLVETWVVSERACPGPQVAAVAATQEAAALVAKLVVAREGERGFAGRIDDRVVVRCECRLGDDPAGAPDDGIRCGERGARLSGSVVDPALGAHGLEVAVAFHRAVLDQQLPALRVERVVTFRAASDDATARLHARLGFTETHRLRRFRILGRDAWSAPVPAILFRPRGA